MRKLEEFKPFLHKEKFRFVYTTNEESCWEAYCIIFIANYPTENEYTISEGYHNSCYHNSCYDFHDSECEWETMIYSKEELIKLIPTWKNMPTDSDGDITNICIACFLEGYFKQEKTDEKMAKDS